MNQRSFHKSSQYTCRIVGRSHRDIDSVKNFQPFTLAADFFGGSLLPCNLLVLFARPAPHALDLAKVPVEQRDDEWEREPEIEARTEIRGSVENDITIDERRQ